MAEAFYALALLACPVGMGLMMWFMMRGAKNTAPDTAASPDEIRRLRAEVESLRGSRQEPGVTGHDSAGVR
ncbi:hypothetical protein [Arthrobacter sp. VKM Ac-2550]|uniref:hypothetical protein n=1 Tax=Crystallibacter permensis TaxID=1938888 RepID=UPI0022277510|nr:hypothetical protein [Arthrobacter sp. VKM Ac-2550]